MPGCTRPELCALYSLGIFVLIKIYIVIRNIYSKYYVVISFYFTLFSQQFYEAILSQTMILTATVNNS